MFPEEELVSQGCTDKQGRWGWGCCLWVHTLWHHNTLNWVPATGIWPRFCQAWTLSQVGEWTIVTLSTTEGRCHSVSARFSQYCLTTKKYFLVNSKWCQVFTRPVFLSKALSCWFSPGNQLTNCLLSCFYTDSALDKALRKTQILKYHSFCLCVSHVSCVLCVCVRVCVSRLSVCVVWSVCHCVSPLPLPPSASHPRGHRLPVGGGRLHRGVGRPLPLHQQEAVFLTRRWTAVSGTTWSPEERTTWDPPGSRWVTDWWRHFKHWPKGNGATGSLKRLPWLPAYRPTSRVTCTKFVYIYEAVDKFFRLCLG